MEKRFSKRELKSLNENIENIVNGFGCINYQCDLSHSMKIVELEAYANKKGLLIF